MRSCKYNINIYVHPTDQLHQHVLCHPNNGFISWMSWLDPIFRAQEPVISELDHKVNPENQGLIGNLFTTGFPLCKSQSRQSSTAQLADSRLGIRGPAVLTPWVDSEASGLWGNHPEPPSPVRAGVTLPQSCPDAKGDRVLQCGNVLAASIIR